MRNPPLSPRQTRVVVPGQNPSFLPHLPAIIAYYSQETGDVGSDNFLSEYGWAAYRSGNAIVGPDSGSEVGSDSDDDERAPALLKILGRVRPYGLCCTPLGTAAYAVEFVTDLADARYKLTIGSPDGHPFDGYFGQVVNHIINMEAIVGNDEYMDDIRSIVQSSQHDQSIEFSSRVFVCLTPSLT